MPVVPKKDVNETDGFNSTQEPALDRGRRDALKAVARFAAATSLVPATVRAQTAPEKPQYGGTLSVGTMYISIGALSWDVADWNWKTADDTGNYYERLFAADFTKAKRNGGRFSFRDNNYIPSEAMRGELAESWRILENPLRLEVKLRRGIMFPEKKGVMAAREFVADDVVFHYNNMQASPKVIKSYQEHVEKVEASDRHTVVFHYKKYYAEWDLRAGYGHYMGIQPKEVVAAGAGNWKNHNGTGPFQIADYVSGSAYTFVKNPIYWDTETHGGQKYKLPYADKLVYNIIKDQSAQHAALRTGKLDILERVNWAAVEELRKNAPALKWARWVNAEGTFLALRMDTKPFDDIRVRRALNMAVNKDEIIKSYYGGNAEMLAFPMYPEWDGYYEPLSAMPESVRELFTYNPDKARKLLAEAGHPNGFTFKTQVYSTPGGNEELLQLVAAYLERVGVKIEIQPMEYGAFLSTMMTKKHTAGYMVSMAQGNPTTAIDKTFVTSKNWNPSMYADPAIDKKMDAAYLERDESKRQVMLRALTREVLDMAGGIWMPVQHYFTAWWPWVKNYGGELRGGGGRPGPVYARIWIDQALKKKMGYR